jgi:hypothetical protein
VPAELLMRRVACRPATESWACTLRPGRRDRRRHRGYLGLACLASFRCPGGTRLAPRNRQRHGSNTDLVSESGRRSVSDRGFPGPARDGGGRPTRHQHRNDDRHRCAVGPNTSTASRGSPRRRQPALPNRASDRGNTDPKPLQHPRRLRSARRNQTSPLKSFGRATGSRAAHVHQLHAVVASPAAGRATGSHARWPQTTGSVPAVVLAIREVARVQPTAPSALTIAGRFLRCRHCLLEVQWDAPRTHRDRSDAQRRSQRPTHGRAAPRSFATPDAPSDPLQTTRMRWRSSAFQGHFPWRSGSASGSGPIAVVSGS